MNAGRNKAKPGTKKASKPAAKKAPAKKAAPKRAEPVRVKPPRKPDVDPTVMPAFPTDAQARAAEKGREANEEREFTADAEKAYGQLTDYERAFVRAYIEERNAEKAALTAGYSPKFARANAGRLLNKPRVRAVLDEVNRNELRALKRTADGVIERLWNEADTAFESAARVKALQLLGDIFQVFPAKRVVHKIDPGLEEFRRMLATIDGAGTGLPPPDVTGDGHRTH